MERFDPDNCSWTNLPFRILLKKNVDWVSSLEGRSIEKHLSFSEENYRGEDDMKSWILPTFGAFLLWGFWSFIPKITMKYIDPKSAVIYEVMGGIILAVIVLFFLHFRVDVHPKGIALGITTGLIGFLGALCFLYAVSKGPVTLVATVSALYPIISIVLAVFFLHETLTVKQGVGIVFGLVAMFLVAS